MSHLVRYGGKGERRRDLGSSIQVALGIVRGLDKFRLTLSLKEKMDELCSAESSVIWIIILPEVIIQARVAVIDGCSSAEESESGGRNMFPVRKGNGWRNLFVGGYLRGFLNGSRPG